jgi:hypothetical protein
MGNRMYCRIIQGSDGVPNRTFLDWLLDPGEKRRILAKNREKAAKTAAEPQKIQMPNEEVEARCNVAIDFLERWNQQGPWILSTTGLEIFAVSRKINDADETRKFLSKCIGLGQQVVMFLPSVDTFVKGGPIPMDEAGRCDTICIAMDGKPDDIRAMACQSDWPDSSAELLTPKGLIMLWRLRTPTDWMTCLDVGKQMASVVRGAYTRTACPLPGATRGVRLLGVYGDAYSIRDFISVPSTASDDPHRDVRPEPAFMGVPSGEPIRPQMSPNPDDGRDPADLRVSARTLRG